MTLHYYSSPCHRHQRRQRSRRHPLGWELGVQVDHSFSCLRLAIKQHQDNNHDHDQDGTHRELGVHLQVDALDVFELTLQRAD